jgi:membrane protein required for colicin V production
MKRFSTQKMASITQQTANLRRRRTKIFMNLTTFDMILLLLLLLSYGLGFRKGVIWQLAGLGSLIVGHLAGRFIMPKLQPYIVEEHGLQHFGAWIGLYLLSAIAVYLVAWRFRKFLQKQELDELDKHLGGLLGLAKGGLLLTFLTLIAITISQNAHDRLLQTKSGPVVAKVAKIFKDYLPSETIKALEPFYAPTEEGRKQRQAVSASIRPTKTPAQIKKESFFQLPPWFNGLARKRRQLIRVKRKVDPVLERLPPKVKEKLPSIPKGVSELLGEGEEPPRPETSWEEPDHESAPVPKPQQPVDEPYDPYDPFKYEPFDPK